MSDGTTLATRQDAPPAAWHKPETYEGIARLAADFIASELTPDYIDTEQKAIITFAMGADLGMAPLQAARAICVVKGKPTLFAEAMAGMCKAHHTHRLWQIVESTDERCEIEVQREGEKAVSFVWDVKRAREMDLWGRGSWRKMPKVMLRHRCESEAARAVWPDVVGGYATREEVESFIDVEPDPVPVAQRAHAFAPNRARHEVAALTQEAMEAQTAPVVEIVAETPAAVSAETQAALEVERDSMAAAELTEAIDGLGLTSAKRLVEAGHRTVDDAAAFIAGGGKVRYLGAKTVEWCIGYMGDGADEEPVEDHSVLEGRIKALSECATGKEMWDYVLLGLVTSKHYETTRDAADVLRDLTGAVDANDAMEIEPVEYSTAWVAAESMAVQKTAS